MSKYKPQHSRLLFIDRKIGEGRYPNCGTLAEEWEVSSKTIMRDLDYMRYQLEAPLEYSAKNRGYYYTEENFKLPIVDNWWQTETGWAIASNMTGIEMMPVKPGSATVPCPGFDVRILDENGKELGANQQGDIAIKLPLPPSCLTTVWGDMDRFKSGYLETHDGYYTSGDGGYYDDEGYLFVMGRVDDVINVAGHRLSTGEMEEIVAKHPDISECAVIGVDDALKGETPMGFVVLKEGIERDDSSIVDAVVQLVREEIGAVASFRIATVVDRLPKTRSGKILRGTMRDIADGKEWNMPSTIEDQTVLPEITKAINALGYPKTKKKDS